GFDPVMAAVMRIAVAATISLLIVIIARLSAPSGMRQWMLAAVSGICCFAIFPIVLGSGIARTSTGHAALIIAMGPVVTGLIAAGLERTVPKKQWWAGTVIALIGVVLLIAEGGDGNVKAASLIGDLICVAGMCIVAVGYIAGGRLSAELNAFAVTCWGLIIAGFALLPILLIRGPGFDWEIIGTSSWGGVVYLAIFSSILGYAGFFWALDKGGVMRISPIQFIVPVAGVIYGYLLFDEVFTSVMLTSTIFIIGGIAFARRA
ncbi:MAG: DMT family transporter, partial [Rhodospirillales bacterium]|nr:DMT family transporter [Rhodospirillales bacterium]